MYRFDGRLEGKRESKAEWMIVVSVTYFSLFHKAKKSERRKKSACCIVYYSNKKSRTKPKKSVFVMHESSNTTVTNTGVVNSRLSFYEYPSHKPYINSIHQPLRPSPNLSKTVSLPESNRDQLLTSLQALSLKIKTLENERKVSHVVFF